MKKAKAVIYDEHRDYQTRLDAGLLNTRIRIYDENYHKTGVIYYEGTVGKFIKERIPSERLVELLPELKKQKRISYRLSNNENYIEKI